MKEGSPGSPNNTRKYSEVWDKCREPLEQRGLEVLGESGKRRPGRGWVRLWVASLCAGPGNPQTVL